MLDERLSLAFSLFQPCGLAADIGTDHARLPVALLHSGRCRRMILTDLSESALENARREISRHRLLQRAELRLGDGLLPLWERCGVISILGMGGRTIRHILLSGRDRLQGADLVLSAHTDLPLVRQALREVGYCLVREEPCFCRGRFYLVWLARPGNAGWSGQVLRLGGPLFASSSPALLPYLRRRRDILLSQLRGLESAGDPDPARLSLLREDLAFYQRFLEGGPLS